MIFLILKLIVWGGLTWLSLLSFNWASHLRSMTSMFPEGFRWWMPVWWWTSLVVLVTLLANNPFTWG